MDKSSLIRTILLVVALGNQFLAMKGWSPLPFSDAEIETGISTIFTAIVSAWAWWKNNYISRTGLRQKKVLQANGVYKK